MWTLRRQWVLVPWAVLLLALQLAAGASHVIHLYQKAEAAPTTGDRFQPPRKWLKGTKKAAPSPICLCGSAAGSCFCSVEDDQKVREAFLAEVQAHGYHDAECRSKLKAYFCEVCTNTTATINTSSALPLGCAGAAAPFISTRHNDIVDDTGGSPNTLCLHRASTQAYDGVVPLKDGSGRLLCWNRNGQIWLAAVDVGPTGFVFRLLGGKPLVDLSSRVSQDAAARGLAGVAVHSSGQQVFVSYYTTTVVPDGGGSAFLVVDQLSSASWSEGNELTTTTSTRVFSMSLPDQSDSSSGFLLDHYGGQILFRPTTTDPFIYLVTAPAQSDGQLQAKILRFRVGQVTPSGNGTVTPMEAQVYAVVLGIPRRCAFDADRAHDLYCAIVKGEQELVYLTSDPDAPSTSATTPSPLLLVAHHRPTPGTPPSLVGGLLYRGYADTTLTGSYIYMDRSEFWWTVASPARNYTTTRNLRVACSASAATSPCSGGDDEFAGSGVTSFAEDADKNALLLATDGVYLVVAPSLCDVAADTKAQATTANKNLLKWVIGVLIGTLTSLGAGYVAYRKCSIFSRRNHINVTAINSNVSIHNGNNNNIQLTVKKPGFI